MKKILILSLLSLCLFASCDTTNPSQPSNTNSITSTIPEGEKYSVQVLLPDGTNAPSNIDVQWCSNVCKPSKTDENGLAILYLEDAEYDIHLYNLPTGYAYQPGKYFANAANRETTITLTSLSTPTSGSGTSNDLFLVNEGVYPTTLSNAEQMNYYSFKANKVGNYLIESWIDETDKIDASLAYYGSDTSSIPSTPLTKIDDENSNNFKYTLEVNSTEQSYIFGLSANIKREKTFNYSISFVE